MSKHRPALLNVLRFLLAWLAAVGIEWGNYALDQKILLTALEAVPAGAFLAGVLWGWPGIVGWSAGLATSHYVRLLQVATLTETENALALRGDALGQAVFAESNAVSLWVAVPISYALLGIVGYLVFRHVGRIGRGFPDARSVLALAAAAAVGGVLTAAATQLLFPVELSLSGLMTHAASNLASVLFFAPPLMLLAGRFTQPLLVPMPRELSPAKRFPENLQIQPSKSEVPIAGQLMLLALGLLASTALVIVIRSNPEAGNWPLLTYLGLILWSALSYGLRGGLLSASLASILYLAARTYTDGDYLPDNADIYSVGLYAEMVVFFLAAVVLGAGREIEVRLRHQMHRRDRMSELLQVAVSSEEAYKIIAAEMAQLLPTTPGALFELKDGTILKEVVTWGEPPRPGRAFTVEDCWALRRGRVHQVSNAEEPAVCAHVEGAEAYICLPLIAQGEAVGVLYLATEEPDGAFLRTLARTMSLSLGNIRAHQELKEQSIRDALTGLVNRRYLNEQLGLEVARASRDASTIGLLILDIDHFKRFNDTWGHEAGDVVLREVARFLETAARQGDVVCRYGGEEFVVVLPGAPLEVVRRRADEMRHGVRGLKPRSDGQTLGAITASFGAALWPLHGASWRDVLEHADHALYEAKRSGRDRVVVAAEPSSTSSFRPSHASP